MNGKCLLRLTRMSSMLECQKCESQTRGHRTLSLCVAPTSATCRLLKLSCQSLTVTCRAPDAEQVGTVRVRCTPVLNIERSAKCAGHWTHTSGRSKLRLVLTGLKLRELYKMMPGCLHTGRTGTASGASRLASCECFSARNTPVTTPNFPLAQ